MNSVTGRIRSQRGISLATILVISLVCTLLIAGMFSTVMPTFSRSREGRVRTALRAASEAALDWAAADLSTGDAAGIDSPTLNQSKTSSVPSGVVGVAGYPITAQVTVANVAPNYATSASYNKNSAQSYLYDPLCDKDLNNNAGVNNWRVVTASATVAGKTSSVRCVMKPVVTTIPTPITTTSTVVTNQQIQGWPFAALAAGKSYDSKGSGAQWDYYDSSVNPNPTSFNTKAGPNDADVSVGIVGQPGSGTSAGFAGGGTVGGDLNTMPGATVSGSPNVTGTKTTTYTGSTFPPAPTHPTGSQLLTTISGAKTLTPGNYYFTGNSTAITGGPITIQNATAANPVKIFIETSSSTAISLNGKNGVFNNTGVPAALQIYVSGTGSVDMGGNGNLRAVIYAPNSDVKMSGNSDFYGAIVGNTVTFNGSSGGRHYDQSLSSASSITFTTSTTTTTTSTSTVNVDTVTPTKNVVSWQEL